MSSTLHWYCVCHGSGKTTLMWHAAVILFAKEWQGSHDESRKQTSTIETDILPLFVYISVVFVSYPCLVRCGWCMCTLYVFRNAYDTHRTFLNTDMTRIWHDYDTNTTLMRPYNDRKMTPIRHEYETTTTRIQNRCDLTTTDRRHPYDWKMTRLLRHFFDANRTRIRHDHDATMTLTHRPDSDWHKPMTQIWYEDESHVS